MIIISTNTLWSAGTATNLTDDVQIAPGVTLTIVGGATVNGNGHSIASFGTLAVTGTASNAAALNNVRVNFGTSYDNPGRIEIDHAVITGGSLFAATGNAVYGSFSVANSVIKNVAAQYVWYPTSDSSFTGNAFVNSGGLGIGTSAGVTVHVTDNLFVGATAAYNGSATIVAWAAYGNPVDVSRNTFLDTDHPALEVTIAGKMTAADNYFGTSDRAMINGLILDRNDDLNHPAYVSLPSIATGPSDVVRAALAASGQHDIIGTSGDDTLAGTVADDAIFGGDGNDSISDPGGSDTLRGGAGNDSFFISRVNNGTTETVRIEGGTGNDTVTYQNYRAGSVSIDLGAGDDKLTLWTRQEGGTAVVLGEGRDVVNFGQLPTAGGTIAIQDFAAGTAGDRLELGEFLGSQLTGWDGSTNPFGGIGYMRLVQAGADTLVQIDRDGASGASYGWSTLVTLQSTTATAMTAYNMGGFDPSGAPLPGSTITGTSANDTLTGSGGTDTISGFAGNDQIDGGAGNDLIYGGDGNDTLQGGIGSDDVDGGEGDDSIADIGGSDTLRGGAGNDSFFISRVNNGTTETVRIEGGTGNDTVTYQNYRAGSVSIDLGAGDDKLTLWTRQEGGTAVVLGEGRDVVNFGQLPTAGGTIAIQDFAAGTAGDRLELGEFLGSQLTGWDGSTNPFGGIGYMRLVQAGADTLVQIDRDGASGASYGWSTLVTLQSTTANAMTAYNMGGWTPRSVSGADIATVVVVAPASVLEGDVASFSLSVTLKNLSSASGTVTMSLAPGSTAGSGDVSVPAYGGSFSVAQSPAHDYTIALPAITVVDDLVVEADKSIDIQVRVTGQVFDNGTDTTVVHVKLIDGDQVGTAANDSLVGTGGNDLLDGRAGADTMTGGAGNDLYYVDDAGDRVVEGVGGGTDTVRSSTSYTLAANVENLIIAGAAAINGSGNDLANIITGNAAANVLNGAAGADTMIGGDGDDTYYVDNVGDIVRETAVAGTDTVHAGISYLLAANVENLVLDGAASINGTGNELANLLVGNTGNNLLSGGAGDDRLVAGGGRDTIQGGAGTDTLVLAGTRHSYAAFTIDGTAYLVGNGEGVRVSAIERVQFADETASWSSVLQSALPFDLARYVATYHDLAFLADNPNGAMNHFAQAGFLEGRIAGSFEALLYIASNADLIRTFGTDTRAAASHYSNAGLAEGRATASFDALDYIASNQDLIRAFGADVVAAERHYVTNGFAEGRATGSFDAHEYIASNVDLIGIFGTDRADAERHYITDGYSEGRSTHSFDAIEYIASNVDLIRAFGANANAAEVHYITSGFSEGRSTDSFDALKYIASNVDLIRAFGADANAAEVHYITNGLSEGRSTDSFDALEYIASNVDLIRAFGANANAAEVHYITHGLNEGRTTDSFDALEYIASNGDLIRAFGTNSDAAELHYISVGYSDGRSTDSFDADAYQASHPELTGYSHNAVLTQYITSQSTTHSADYFI
ncbi:beta strand repeat-containing protein [Sphingomonas sp. R86521]|uniref:beta strand repeat-containing protein n=1 Tax=Sphingomonas sp. R86521 TaxID=3093860 RepID=UPI0036D2CE30